LELEIRDIKPLVEIPDYSFYLFLFVISLALAVLVASIIFIVKRLKSKKQDLKKLYLQKLKDLDLSDTKNSAYLITEYGKYLATNERAVEIYNNLLDKLSSYKYRKDVPSFDKEIEEELKLFIEVANV